MSDGEFTRFERARIVGARALQISMGAPIVIDVEESMLHDPVGIAEIEYNENLIPITVLRPEGGHRPKREHKGITVGKFLRDVHSPIGS